MISTRTFTSARRRGPTIVVLSVLLAAAPAGAQVEPDSPSPDPVESRAADCRPGARTLAQPGDVLYPETGNGGYRGLHTDVHLVYRPGSNRFLRGTHVVLRLQAGHCLSELSLDFERRDVADRHDGPRLKVKGVRVDDAAASYRFARPTYPGNPHGPDDPDPRAHQASQTNPVGGPRHNPLPPACSPQLGGREARDARDGTMCPATKLVITPATPIPAGQRFTVRVDYVGHPGAHRSGNGGKEGWLRTKGGNAMLTEPVGSQAWMPLNNHPTAKVPYDFHIRTARDKTVIANGQRVGIRRHRPDRRFPKGSATTHWHARDPIASYLVLAMIGDYRLTRERVGGITYHLAQDRHIPPRLRRANLRRMRQLADSTRFLARFNGRFPFPSNGVVAAVPGGDVMEMQTMTVFGGSRVDLSILYHENMHQWWGDHVTQGSYDMVFFKEGLATFGESLLAARQAARRSPRPGAFRRALTAEFDRVYHRKPGFWRQAPSRPTAYTYFSDQATYLRPSAAYLALMRILGRKRFVTTLRQIQHRYGDATITRPQLERAFHRNLPVDTAACHHRLDMFFDQWFDTAYPTPDGAQRPRITGPGLAGGGFYTEACPRP